jgi:hypothetical protein
VVAIPRPISQTDPTGRTIDGRPRKPLARYGAVEGALRERLSLRPATPPPGTRPPRTCPHLTRKLDEQRVPPMHTAKAYAAPSGNLPATWRGASSVPD